jgi:hypothetical protein
MEPPVETSGRTSKDRCRRARHRSAIGGLNFERGPAMTLHDASAIFAIVAVMLLFWAIRS